MYIDHRGGPQASWPRLVQDAQFSEMACNMLVLQRSFVHSHSYSRSYLRCAEMRKLGFGAGLCSSMKRDLRG